MRVIRLSKRARIGAALMAGFGLVVFVLILLAARPNNVVHRAEALETYDVSAPAPPSPANAPPSLALSAPTPLGGPPPPPDMAQPIDEAGDAATVAPIEVSIPKLAYAYSLGFRLDGNRIAAAQDTHRRLCAQMGPARCQLMAMSRGAADETQTAAHLKLRVASAEAQHFSDTLIKLVAAQGGRAIATSVSAEDVSKEIVDAEARIHQRELLVARLTEILRTRSGRVAELVEAERSVAQAQEELDQTKGWLTELRGRVAMSDFDISYEAAARQVSPEVSKNDLGDAIRDSVAAFALTLKSLLTLLIYLVPWLLVLGPIMFFLWRRARRNRTVSASPPEGEL